MTLGGSYTNGWVDQELMETQKGDEKAVGKIVEFLAATLCCTTTASYPDFFVL